jgi:hypothetical protein
MTVDLRDCDEGWLIGTRRVTAAPSPEDFLLSPANLAVLPAILRRHAIYMTYAPAGG